MPKSKSKSKKQQQQKHVARPITEDDAYDEETGQCANVTLYGSTPLNGKDPIGWVPIHINALSSNRMRECLVRLGDGPYDVVFLALDDPQVAAMADAELWPFRNAQSKKLDGRSYSQVLQEDLHFGAMVAHHHWDYWFMTHITDEGEREHIRSYVMERDNNHDISDLINSPQVQIDSDHPDALRAREEARLARDQRISAACRAFGEKYRDAPDYPLRAIARKALLHSYFVVRDTAAPELNDLLHGQAEPLFHPHMPLSGHGYVKHAIQQWSMSSFHQRCAPFDLSELHEMADQTRHEACSASLAAVYFDPEQEL